MLHDRSYPLVSRAKEDEDKGPVTLGVVWAGTILASLCVFARLYIRMLVLRNPGLDDWLIAVTVIFSWAVCGVVTASVTYGFGKHTATLDIADAEEALLYNSLSFIFGIVAFALPKLAISSLLCKILNPSRLQRWILWGLTSMVAAIALVNILVYVTMCDPSRAVWRISMVTTGEATCRDIWILVHYATLNGAFSAFTDAYLATYPGFVLFRLNMSVRRKIGLTVALGLGYCAAAVAIVKTTSLKGLADQTNPTWGTVDLVIWTSVEGNVVVIASCIPTLRPLVEKLSGKSRIEQSSGALRQNTYVRAGSQQGSKQQRSNKQPTMGTGMAGESQENFAIRRTDDIHVDYELQPQAPAADQKSFT